MADPHELALRVRRLLPVQSAQNASCRARMIVLDEADALAEDRRESPFAEALEEEAPRVGVDLRLDDEHASDRGRGRFHRADSAGCRPERLFADLAMSLCSRS